jgi:hypothetical protein
MIYLFLIYSFYIINFSFIIKSDCTKIIENIEEKIKTKIENEYYNTIECSIKTCASNLINENICYNRDEIKSIYGFGKINQCFEDGNDVPIPCNDFNCSDPNGLTELDSDGKWLGYLRCTRDYIDINDIDENVDEKKKNPNTQYRYDFKFNFLSEPDKKSTKTGAVQSQFLNPFENSRNYDDLLAYYYSQCINGYYEKSCNYLFNYCVIAMYNDNNGICRMIQNFDDEKLNVG